MKLKRQREDVRDLKLMQDNYIQAIAERYRNLILMAEEFIAKGKYSIGDELIDEDGNEGIVVIRWNDGDICEYENDSAHPNPKLALSGGSVCRKTSTR